jgi:hypothetical protein
LQRWEIHSKGQRGRKKERERKRERERERKREREIDGESQRTHLFPEETVGRLQTQ